MKLTCGALGLAIMIAVSGCAAHESAKSTDSDQGSYASKTASAGSNADEAFKASATSEAPLHYAARQPGGQRNVVRQATLGVEVDNLEKSEKGMREAISSHGGYVDHLEGNNLAGEQPSMQLTIRVPEKSFDELMSIFEGLGHRTQKSVSASDITERILEAEARLKQLQGMQSVLTQKRTASTMDTGFDSIKDQIKQVQQEKEELASKAEMATIELTLSQKANADLSTAAHATWGSDTWNAAMSSAMGAFRFFGAIAIWLLAYSPIWGIVLFGSLWGVRVWKRSPRRAQIA